MKHVPFWLKSFFLSLFPRPTLSIYLYNDPEVLHQRRPEESIPELKRQMTIFSQFEYSLKVKTNDQEMNNEIIKNYLLISLMRNWR